MILRRLSSLSSLLYVTALMIQVIWIAVKVGTGRSELVDAVPEVATKRISDSTIQLDSGTFVGRSTMGVTRYLGIPFALPPVGNLRFAKPVASRPYNGTYDAQNYGPACPQQAIKFPPIIRVAGADAVNLIENLAFKTVLNADEDCLTVNVITPSFATPTSKLPVIVWIFGGGFQTGGTSTYDGGDLVSRSVLQGSPVVYASMNYRLSAFGFLASKEVKAAGVANLGLQDQRLALRWVQKYISSFGGDPTKVTIWGQSAGAMSVASHMITNGGDTEDLFRAGVMQSGSPLPVGDVSHGQPDYDALVNLTGCSGEKDTLQCLREVSYDKLKRAVDVSPMIFDYQSLRLAWLPRVDGEFFTDTPQNLVKKGSVANIPYITGNCDDEGTLFSLSSLNITTTDQVKGYLLSNYFLSGEDDEISRVLDLYPADLSAGSPFDTGILNGLTPQFKRLSALLGDAVFQAPRRLLLNNTSEKQAVWAFLSKRGKLTPALGTFHTTDLENSYGGGELSEYIIRFTNTLNPNQASGDGFQWPRYDKASRQLLTFSDGLFPQSVTADTYRQEGMKYLTELSFKYPI